MKSDGSPKPIKTNILKSSISDLNNNAHQLADG